MYVCLSVCMSVCLYVCMYIRTCTDIYMLDLLSPAALFAQMFKKPVILQAAYVYVLINENEIAIVSDWP